MAEAKTYAENQVLSANIFALTVDYNAIQVDLSKVDQSYLHGMVFSLSSYCLRSSPTVFFLFGVTHWN